MNRRTLALLAGALLALSGCRPAAQPEPAAPAPPPIVAEPPPPEPEPLHFVIYGDCRSRPEKHREVVAQIVKVAPQFVIQTGDLVGGTGADPSEWEQAYAIIQPLQAMGDYHMAMGNHDRGNPDYVTQLGLPVAQPGDTWYSFVEGDVRFFVLNTNTLRLPDEGESQLAWLKEALAAATEPFKLVIMHHPPYAIGGYKPGDPTIRQRLCPLLTEYGVTAAFSGHDHGYYRTLRDGVHYVITAGGGAPLYDQDPEAAQSGDVFKKTLNFMVFDRTAAGLEAKALDETGAEFDRFTLPVPTAAPPGEPTAPEPEPEPVTAEP